MRESDFEITFDKCKALARDINMLSDLKISETRNKQTELCNMPNQCIKHGCETLCQVEFREIIDFIII